MLWSAAYAQAAGTPAQPSLLESMVPILAMLGIFYFFIIRPQMKRQKEHQKFVTELKRGDQVITSGGILGRVEGITEGYLTLEIADDVKIKILKSNVMMAPKEKAQ